VTVIVEDDGTGIAPDFLPHLFEPFQTTKEDKGVGLGLAISRTIVERHRGSINVVSEVGRGTKFTMTFPAEEGAGRRGRGADDVLASSAPLPLTADRAAATPPPAPRALRPAPSLEVT